MVLLWLLSPALGICTLDFKLIKDYKGFTIAELYRSSCWVVFCGKAVLKIHMKTTASEIFRTTPWAELYWKSASDCVIVAFPV